MAPKARHKAPLCGRELGTLSASDRGEDIGELSKDGSMYSLSADILPSLGATAGKSRFKLRRFVISPFDRRYRYSFIFFSPRDVWNYAEMNVRFYELNMADCGHHF